MRRRSARFVLAASAALALSACARSVATIASGAPTVTGAPAVGSEETGLASWYGHPYHGRRTASGEVYDMQDLTAAHRTLPLGTRLLVTSLNNDQVVEVRVNDRGPFVAGRILDLSYGASSSLGAVEAGVIPVRIRVIALPGDGATGPAASAGSFSVQLGVFINRVSADRLRDAAAQDGSRAAVSKTIVAGDVVYRVRVGPYPSRQEANAAAQRLAARGYLAVVVADP